MEFETPDNYGAKGPKSGRVKSNIGCIYSSKIGQPLVVCSQTGPDDAATVYGATRSEPVSSGDICRATHTSTAKDPETGYDGPTGLKFEWVGKQIGQPGKQVKASLEVETSMEVGKGGLIEKVCREEAFESAVCVADTFGIAGQRPQRDPLPRPKGAQLDHGDQALHLPGEPGFQTLLLVYFA